MTIMTLDCFLDGILKTANLHKVYHANEIPAETKDHPLSQKFPSASRFSLVHCSNNPSEIQAAHIFA
jgi:hypothetical protein